MKVRWTKRFQQEHEVLAQQLSQELGLPQRIVEVLLARGFSDRVSIEKVFSPKLKDLRDPLTIRDMQKAVDRLELALDRQEKICVYADYDLDGSSGLGLLYEALKKMGFKSVVYYQPKRLSEGYGVHAHALGQLHSDGVQVVVTVDVGITALAAMKRGRDLGLDIIITDHHLPTAQLPEAFAIVNPNSGCSSSLGHLSGAGVAFYLVLALKRQLAKNSKLKNDFDTKELLDFFTIGTLTDMVPLIGENRSLVRHGLTQLAKTQRHGLKELLRELNLLGRELTSQDVAIQFAPKLNALSRMEIGLLPVDLFFAESEERAKEMVTTVTRNNRKRKDLQAFAEGWAMENSAHQVEKGFVFVCNEHFHKGVIGLVATKLCQKYSVPAFVGAIKNGDIVGSARAPERSVLKLTEVLESCRKSLERFGGHAKAAGFSMPLQNRSDFEADLTKYFLNRELLSPEIEYDIDLEFSDINEKFLKFQNGLEPFGQGFPQPRYRLVGELVGEKVMAGGHKKLLLKNNCELVYFSPPENFEVQPKRIEALVRVQKNHFRERESVQLLIDDVRYL